jgi:pyrroloquinoline-quinone synthase
LTSQSLARGDFEARLREEGRVRYHDRHPFHRRMHDGLLSPDELRTWALNRYYYQTRLPIKDALILAKTEDRVFRRKWAQRLREQDGSPDGDIIRPARSNGGLELWLRLAEGVGLERERVENCTGILPGVRSACDRYVSFVHGATLLEAVASSLTECFAPDLMARRLDSFTRHYAWIPSDATAYFGARVTRARKDAEHGLSFVLDNATTASLQDGAVHALIAKCEILWSMLDAIDAAGRADPSQERTAQ